jgi:hypothetical protein
MADVIARFIRPVPPRILIRGEWWSIRTSHDMKGRHAYLSANCETDGRSIELASGRSRGFEGLVAGGFHVISGTPARGLVTELRRLGYVELKPWGLRQE